jgi:very-short-patch-repair endonuclease
MSKEIQQTLAKKIKETYENIDIIFNDIEPYTLYRINDIAEICKIINIRSSIRNYGENEKVKIKCKTKGGDQIMNYLTYDGLLKLFIKSRKETNIDFIKLFNIDIKTAHYMCIETDTLNCIKDTFNKHTMISQYKIDNYYIDLYFIDYKLAIECDENHYNIEDDKIRQSNIESKLGCKFIRYKPYEKNFNIFKLLNSIYKFIYDYNLEKKEKFEEQVNKLKEEYEFKIIILEKDNKSHKDTILEQSLEIQEMKELIEKQKETIQNIKVEQESSYQNPLLPEDDLTQKFTEFINKMCIVREDVEESSTNMEGQYRIWCKTKPKKEIFHAFKNYLDTRFKPKRLSNQTKNQVVHGYVGVKLKDIEYKKTSLNNDVETFAFQVCKFSPSGKILTSTLLTEYQKWKKSLNKDSNENDLKEVKEYFNCCEHVIKAQIWLDNNSSEGYYGILLKWEEDKHKNTSSTGKKVNKIEILTNQIIGSWETIAKAADYENISRAKMSRSIKAKTIFNNDYYYSGTQ